ncbi:MAG: DUF4935 domain-containing protein [Candidatus Thiodiazotropha sp. (ex Codakia orbicularis)]|nr:DUF4935 domain-containing protein [Candidatus Thiodiazotropha sp. (ex Codakia orbicularis)]
MKNIFKGYYKLTDDEFKALWENAIFVFDTNVLLNLYRYQSSTRDSLFAVIERLAERVWIPYHVGLEFQRNRLKVIAAQHKRYSEVQKIVTSSIASLQSELDGLQLKKRHSHIDPDKLIQGIEKTKNEFLSELGVLEEQSISVSSHDAIRERIDKLFSGKIGSAPTSQDEMEDLFKEAEIRYKNAIPPGFEDSKKDDTNPDDFTYGGITYKRKYGDLIVWKQLISYVSSESIKDIIFVTDDTKSDWWRFIDSNGRKNVGVRPELTDELYREARVERFYAYSTEGFLNYANEQLGAEVTEEAIEEVREISVSRRRIVTDHRSFRHLALSAEKAVHQWLESSFSELEENRRGFPDFVGYQDKHKYGFEVMLIREPRMMIHRLRDLIHRAYYILNEEGFFEVALIFVVMDEHQISEMMRFVKRRSIEMAGNIRIIVGKVDVDEEENYAYDFIPYDEVHLSNGM